MNPAENSSAAAGVAGAFERSGVRYAMVGSMASALHGEPRATMDVDFVALMRLRDVERFLQELPEEFSSDPGIREAVRERQLFQLLHLKSFIKIDVYVRAESGPDAGQVLRARRETLRADPPVVLNVATPEDTVLHKLAWYLAGDGVSDRQWRDVLGVLKAQGSALDFGYITTEAAGRGLSELLLRARRESAL